MKWAFVLLPLFLFGCAENSQAPAPASQPMMLESNPVNAVVIDFPGSQWSMSIKSDGSASLQYVSTIGDSASLPTGTIDFRRTVGEVERQESQANDGTWVILEKERQLYEEGFYLRNDRYFRELIDSLNDKWQEKGWRFDQLLKEFPIYRSKASAAKQGDDN